MTLPARPQRPPSMTSDGATRPALGAGQRWYVAMTLPYKEAYAGTNLARQGIRHFLPQHLVTIRHARKLRTALTPIFPRYLFVALDIDRQRWRSVNGTFGVQRLVGEGEAPSPVPAGVVEALIGSSDPRGRWLGPTQSLQAGDPVRMLRGPFAGQLGVLLQLNGAERVQLLFEIVGAPVRVSAPRNAIVAL